MSALCNVSSPLLLSGVLACFMQTAHAQRPLPNTEMFPVRMTMTYKFSLDYKRNILSVRETDGRYLFKRITKTPTVRVKFEAGEAARGVKITLRDVSGKQIGTSTVALGYRAKGGQGFSFSTSAKGGIQFVVNHTTSATPSPKKASPTTMNFAAALDSNNAFLSGNFKTNQGSGHFQRSVDGSKLLFTKLKDNQPIETATIRLRGPGRPVTASFVLLPAPGHPLPTPLTVISSP